MNIAIETMQRAHVGKNSIWCGMETYMSAPMESIMNGYEDPRGVLSFLPHARMSRLKDSIVESGRELASLIAIIWVCRS